MDKITKTKTHVIPFLPPTNTLVASVFKSRPLTTTPAPNSAV